MLFPPNAGSYRGNNFKVMNSSMHYQRTLPFPISQVKCNLLLSDSVLVEILALELW